MLEKDESFQGASVADIGCGYQHCIAVTTCGKVFVWGSAGFSFHEPHLVHQVIFFSFCEFPSFSCPDFPSMRRNRCLGFRVFQGLGFRVQGYLP